MDAADFIKYRETGDIKDITLKDLYKINFNDIEGRSFIAEYDLLLKDGSSKFIKVYFNDTYLLDDETPRDFAEGMTWLYEE